MRKIVLLLFLLPFFSCRTLNPSIMFQTGKDYPYSADSTKNKSAEYMIAADDHLDLHIFTNDGFKLVDVTSTGTAVTSQATYYYLVEPDGTVKLPLIRSIQLKGMTIREAEHELEKRYADFYIQPFVLLRVINRHVLVFQGDGGTGTVINLQNENTTLLEALTLAGGIHNRGKAFKIKIIRGDLKNPEIFLIDLSTIDGMKKSNLTIQANDIIYVEPSPDYSTKVLTQLTPFIGILTSVLLVFNLFKK